MKHPRRARRLDDSTRIPARELTSVSGRPIRVPCADAIVHLQFRRFAGCPVCNLHLASFVRGAREIRGASIREVVVFHSSTEALRPHVSDLPFDVVADPEKTLYREFGVESSLRAILDPHVWWPIARGVLRSLWAVLRDGRPVPSIDPAGGRLGLPADFLISPDGRILASKYGRHAYDQWSVEELLEIVRGPAPAGGERQEHGPGRPRTVGSASLAQPVAAATVERSVAGREP